MSKDLFLTNKVSYESFHY